MLKSFKFQLNPNQEELELFKKNVGSCRWLYNRCLAEGIEYHKQFGCFLPINDLMRDIPELKIKFPWLKECEASSLQQVLRDQYRAFQNFLKHKRGFPNFKSKHKDQDSFRLTNSNKSRIRFQGKWIRLGKIGFVNITRANKQLKRLPLKYIIKSATISKDSDQHWYASVLIECENQALLPRLDNIIGIDLGIKNNYKVCYLNNEELAYHTIDNPKAFEKECSKLAKLQQSLSRKAKDSKNREKAKIKVAKKYFRIKSIRKDFNHQLSKYLINNFQMIVIEDLDLEQMKQNHLGRQISDLGFYQFRTFLQYKTEWYGRELVIADKYFASTKICAECGYKNDLLKITDRQYICPSCKTQLDRDENASKNLYQLGICWCDSGEVFKSQEYINKIQK